MTSGVFVMFLRMSRCAVCLLFAFLVAASPVAAQEVTTIEPGTFNYMAEHSLGFVEGYEQFQQEIEDRDISFMITYNGVAPNEYSRFKTRTDFGEADVRPTRDTFYLYTSWGSERIQGYYFDVFISSLSLKVQQLEIGDTVITQDENLTWHSKYVAASLGAIVDTSTRIGFGILTKEDPIIVEQDNGTGSFSINTEDENFSTFSSDSAPFAHILWGILRYDAVFSSGFVNSSRLRLTAWDHDGLSVKLGANSYKDLLQVGAEYHQDFGTRAAVDIQAFSTVKDEREVIETDERYGYAAGIIDVFFFRSKRPRMPGQARDFHMIFRYGASYSDYLFEKPVTGEEVRLTLRNIRLLRSNTYFDFAIGSSYNYLPTLNYLPLAEKQLVYVRLSLIR